MRARAACKHQSREAAGGAARVAAGRVAQLVGREGGMDESRAG